MMILKGDQQVWSISFLTGKHDQNKNYTSFDIDIEITLVLILSKMSRYVKAFKDKGRDKLMSFCIDDHKLLGKYKIIQTKIEDLKHIELKPLPGYDDKYIKTKIRT